MLTQVLNRLRASPIKKKKNEAKKTIESKWYVRMCQNKKRKFIGLDYKKNLRSC